MTSETIERVIKTPVRVSTWHIYDADGAFICTVSHPEHATAIATALNSLTAEPATVADGEKKPTE